MKIEELPVDEAIASLCSDHNGLSHAEALRRLSEYGPNRIEEVKHVPLYLRLLRQFTNFFALVLWLAAGLAMFADSQAPESGMAALAQAVVAVIVINGLFAFWQEYRAERALSALRALLPLQVQVMRESKLMLLDVVGLVPGDVILLEAGSIVPADSRLLEARSLLVNNSTLSGESVPQVRTANAVQNCPVHLLATNLVLAGATVQAGQARAIVYATGAHTEFGQIAKLTQAGNETQSPLQQEIARLSHWISLFAVMLGVGFFAIGQALGLPFWNNFVFAIGVIVANVPEGLLPTVTLALALAAERMAKQQALIRHLPSAETLGAATVICTDKTGTLTRNVMEVRHVVLGVRQYEVEDLKAGPSLAHDAAGFMRTARLAQTLNQGPEQTLLGDPMEVALVTLSDPFVPAAASMQRLDVLPFDADRMRMSTVHATGSGPCLYCKGAPEAVLPLCSRIEQRGSIRPLLPRERRLINDRVEALANDGLRVLALAYRPVETSASSPPERDLIYVGLAGLEDPPRPEVPAAVGKCMAAGIRVIMITGDHPHTALAIGRKVGITGVDHARVITGEQLRRMSPNQLQLALDAPNLLFARVSAVQKLDIVNALKRKGHTVAVTGDGVNDAPALRAAHIGIAMGRCGSDVARAAADMILLDDNFATIVKAVEEGRTIFQNIRKFLIYILTSNVPELVPYLLYALFDLPLALTIMQILAIDLGTDLIPALGLGASAPAEDVMRMPPRPASERLVHWRLIGRAYAYLGTLEAILSIAAFFGVLLLGGWQPGDLSLPVTLYAEATAACLTCVVMAQVANVLICNNPREHLFSHRHRPNRIIVAGVLIELAVLTVIVYTHWGNVTFGTAAVSGAIWLYAMVGALCMLMIEEVRKFVVRQTR